MATKSPKNKNSAPSPKPGSVAAGKPRGQKPAPQKSRKDASRKEISETRWAINFRLLGMTTAAVLVIGIGMFFWSTYQVSAQSSSLLTLARQERDHLKYAEAISAYRRYLTLRPDDLEVLAEFAELFATKSNRPWLQRVQVVDEAIGKLQQDENFDQARTNELRVIAGELHFEMGHRFKQVVELEKAKAALKPIEPKTPASSKLLARCLLDLRDSDPDRFKADDLFQTLGVAYELNPGDPEVTLEYARAIRTGYALEHKKLTADQRAQQAESVMAKLTMEHAQDPFAWLAAFNFHMDVDNRVAAANEIGKALELAPEAAEREFVIWSRAGLFSAMQNDRELAIRQFEMAIERQKASQLARAERRKALARSAEKSGAERVEPLTEEEDEEVTLDDKLILGTTYTSLATLEFQKGERDKAIETLNKARERVEDVSDSVDWILTQYLAEMGNLQGSREALSRIQDRYVTNASLTTRGYATTQQLDEIETEILLMDAKLSQREGKFFDSIETWQKYLVRLGTSVRTEEVVRKRVDAYLAMAQCYMSLENFDEARKQIDLADKALARNSQVAFAFGNLAERQGQISEALAYYRAALDMHPVFYPAREGFARVMLNLARASGTSADWREFDAQMADLDMLPPAEQEKWALFQADAAMVRQDHDEAARLLKAVLVKNPNSTKVLEALALNSAVAGNDQKSQEYAQQLKDVSVVRYHVLQFELLGRTGENEKAADELNQAIAKASNQELPVLKRLLAEFELTRLNKPEQGRARLAALVRETGIRDLGTYRRLAELAIDANDLEEAESYVKQIEGIEGSGEATSQYLIGRIALRRGDVETAKKSLVAIEGMRSRWAPIKLLEALIAEEEQRYSDAVIAYQDAVRYGERNPYIAAHIYQLLGELDRYADADAFLRNITSESREIGLAVAIRNREFDQAVTFAKASLDENDKDLRNWIRYGSALMFAGRTDEALETFQKAVELEPTNPQALIQLVGCAISKFRTTRTEADLKVAEQYLERFKSEAKAQPETLAFLGAQCYQLLGEMEKADAEYRLAVRVSNQKDLNILRTAGPFFADRDRAYAIELLTAAKELDPKAEDLTRLLAVLYSEAGTGDDWQHAYEVLAQEAGETNLDNRRLLALMMLRTGDREQQEKARETMEQVIAESVRKSPQDLQLLAEIYEKTGNLPEAIAKMREALGNPKASPDANQYFIQLLIQNKDYGEAERLLDELRSKKAIQPGFLVGSLCQIAQQRGEAAKIDGIIASFVDPEIAKSDANKLVQVQMMMFAAGLAEQFGRTAAAENWHKRRLETMPETFTTYGVWLAQQGRGTEAVDLAIQHAKVDDIDSMIGLLTILTMSGAQPADVARTKDLVDKAFQVSGTQVDFLIALATLRQIQGQTREAITYYERALRESGQSSVPALNNLALLLSETRDRREDALRYIEKAINSRGTDNTALLDTKAAVLISLERYEDALKLMQRIILRVDDNPVYYLHLAECQLQSGDRDAAIRSLANAETYKIDSAVLTKPDTVILRRLRSELANTQESVQ